MKLSELLIFNPIIVQCHDNPDVDAFGEEFPGLLVTTDCQYGAGNVTKFPAKYVAIIDHHQEEIKDV